MRWAGRVASPSPRALPRMMPAELLPASTREDVALPPSAAACRAIVDATLSEALGQGGHW